MSLLKEKNKKLFRRGGTVYSEKGIPPKREDFYLSDKSAQNRNLNLKDENKFLARFSSYLTRKKIILFGQIFLFVFLFVLLGIFLFIRYQENSFSEDRLMVTTECDGQVRNGERLVCRIDLQNDNRLDLSDVALRISYSNELDFVENESIKLNSGLKFGQLEIGDFAAGEKKSFLLEFDVFGSGGSQVFLDSVLRYKLNNFGVMMEKKSQFSGFIESSPLAVVLISPDDSAEGELIEFQVVVKNESQQEYSNLILKAEYPAGFALLESGGEASRLNENSWLIDRLSAGQQKMISFRGNLIGPLASSQEMKVVLGVQKEADFIRYAETSRLVKIVANRIQLEHFINGKKDFSVANDGQILEFRIVFKNNSDRPLRDLVLTESLEGFYINEKRLNLYGKGFYDGLAKKIIWRASEVESLALLNPGQSGQVSFTVYLKEKLPIEKDEQVNQVLSHQTEIESLDVGSPLGENKKIVSEKKSVKINSLVLLDLFGSSEDERFPSFGPKPMETDMETSVVLKLRLKNSFNDLNKVAVRLALPSRVSWKNNYRVSSGQVSYNERSQELVWERGQVKAGTGYYLAEDFLHFQVGVTPSENDSSRSLMKLVSRWQLTAEDSFTGQKINREFSEFNLGSVEGF